MDDIKRFTEGGIVTGVMENLDLGKDMIIDGIRMKASFFIPDKQWSELVMKIQDERLRHERKMEKSFMKFLKRKK